MVKAYSLRQLAVLDWVDTRTVKHSWKYIPVRIDDIYSRAQYNVSRYKKPYKIRYLRVDEIIYIYDKRNRMKKLIETPI